MWYIWKGFATFEHFWMWGTGGSAFLLSDWNSLKHIGVDEFLHNGTLKFEKALSKGLYQTQHEAYASKMIQKSINLDNQIKN